MSITTEIARVQGLIDSAQTNHSRPQAEINMMQSAVDRASQVNTEGIDEVEIQAALVTLNSIV